MKTVAVIDNYDSFVHNLIRYVREEDCKVISYRNDDEALSDLSILDEADALLLSPGPGRPENAGKLLEILSKYTSSKPILGVCLGHQAMAMHFGTKLEQETIPVHGKASRIKRTGSSRLLSQLPKHIDVGRYHSWRVAAPPPDFTTTAHTDDGIIMAMEHDELPLFGVQFHPESILTPEGRTIIRNFISTFS